MNRISSRFVALGSVLFTCGCAEEPWAPPTDVSTVNLTMTDAPDSTGLYRFEGVEQVSRTSSVPLLGPIVCSTVPCDTKVTAGQYLVATSPEFRTSQAVKVPRAAEVTASVSPGPSWAMPVAITSLIAGAGALAGGIFLATQETDSFDANGHIVSSSPDTGAGAALIVGGTALGVFAIVAALQSRTRLKLITPDGVVHF
jgi:hypothetical protein